MLCSKTASGKGLAGVDTVCGDLFGPGWLCRFALVAGAACVYEWFFDHFTSADTYFYWSFRRGTQFKPDLSHFTNCMAHMQRIEQRPSVQKLLAYEKSVIAQFNKT